VSTRSRSDGATTTTMTTTTTTNAPVVTSIHIDSSTGKCKFGLKSYWDDMYNNNTEAVQTKPTTTTFASTTRTMAAAAKPSLSPSSSSSSPRSPRSSYSWYCGWKELEPFWTMLVPNRHSRVLVAGIGNDPTPVQMYDAGWNTSMIAYDYSEAAVQQAKDLFGPIRYNNTLDTTTTSGCPDDNDDKSVGRSGGSGLLILTADARTLPLPNASVDATLDKGTLDAIYISGLEALEDAVQELGRVTAPDGVVVCISRVILPHLLVVVGGKTSDGVLFAPPLWEVIHDGSLAFAEPNGEATIDLGADLYSFRRTQVSY
jgi:SAM-dependent methyltransferase